MHVYGLYEESYCRAGAYHPEPSPDLGAYCCLCVHRRVCDHIGLLKVCEQNI